MPDVCQLALAHLSFKLRSFYPILPDEFVIATSRYLSLHHQAQIGFSLAALPVLSISFQHSALSLRSDRCIFYRIRPSACLSSAGCLFLTDDISTSTAQLRGEALSLVRPAVEACASFARKN